MGMDKYYKPLSITQYSSTATETVVDTNKKILYRIKLNETKKHTDQSDHHKYNILLNFKYA